MKSSSEVKCVIILDEMLPVCTGGSGKFIFAYFSDREIGNFLRDEALIPFTPNTITNPESYWNTCKKLGQKVVLLLL